MQIRRIGRDMPGSNWHTYPFDPDGHTNELYYGIEQIGWDGLSQAARHARARLPRARPTCRRSPSSRRSRTRWREGIDLAAGYRHVETRRPNTTSAASCCRGRSRSCKHRAGAALRRRYGRGARASTATMLGLAVTEEVTWQRPSLRLPALQHRAPLDRALPDGAAREARPVAAHDAACRFGMQLGDYRQLRDAVALPARARASRIKYLPPELFPGIDYAAFAIDPDGHAIQLYYYMEQIGWDGRPRPASAARSTTTTGRKRSTRSPTPTWARPFWGRGADRPTPSGVAQGRVSDPPLPYPGLGKECRPRVRHQAPADAVDQRRPGPGV